MPRKIPAECRYCDEPLTRSDMELYLKLCEKAKVDPIELAFKFTPPGAACIGCLTRSAIEHGGNGDPKLDQFLSKLEKMLKENP